MGAINHENRLYILWNDFLYTINRSPIFFSPLEHYIAETGGNGYEKSPSYFTTGITI